MTDELAYCNPKVTCVVELDLEAVWKIVRQWSTFYWLDQVQGQPCFTQLYEGGEHQIGSIRTIEIGDSLMFEKLVAMDDETHTMKWRTIAHEESRTPFKEASYINAILTLHLRDITHDNHTFCEWQVVFYTDQELALEMHAGLEAWMVGAFQTLQQHVLTEDPTVDHRRPQQIPQPVQSNFPEDHLSRFADLHISPGVPGISQQYQMPARHYQIPPQDPLAYLPQGVPDPHILQQPGKPMGSKSRQAQMPVISPPQMEAWQSAQTLNPNPAEYQPRRGPSSVASESIAHPQDWAAKKQRAQRQRHMSKPMGSAYAASAVSRGSSMDGSEPYYGPPPSRGGPFAPRQRGMPQSSMNWQGVSQPGLNYPDMSSQGIGPKGVAQQTSDMPYHVDLRVPVDQTRVDPRQPYTTPPMGGPQGYYDVSQMYDPRLDPVQGSRSRPSGHLPKKHSR